ncbi:MAG: hypothetical protein WCY84_02685 [Candidatus Cloacimonadaceae bacterium]
MNAFIGIYSRHRLHELGLCPPLEVNVACVRRRRRLNSKGWHALPFPGVLNSDLAQAVERSGTAFLGCKTQWSCMLATPEAVSKHNKTHKTRNVHTLNVGVQGIEPAENYTQKIIITDSVSIYYGVRCAQALLKAVAKHSSPYILISLDIVLAFGISGQPLHSAAQRDILCTSFHCLYALTL